MNPDYTLAFTSYGGFPNGFKYKLPRYFTVQDRTFGVLPQVNRNSSLKS